MNHMPLRIEYVALSLLYPNNRNARTHSKKQIQQIANSIKAFGFTNPLLIDEANTLIVGHGRLEAAQDLGLETVPAVRLVKFHQRKNGHLCWQTTRLRLMPLGTWKYWLKS